MHQHNYSHQYGSSGSYAVPFRHQNTVVVNWSAQVRNTVSSFCGSKMIIWIRPIMNPVLFLFSLTHSPLKEYVFFLISQPVGETEPCRKHWQTQMGQKKNCISPQVSCSWQENVEWEHLNASLSVPDVLEQVNQTRKHMKPLLCINQQQYLCTCRRTNDHQTLSLLCQQSRHCLSYVCLSLPSSREVLTVILKY